MRIIIAGGGTGGHLFPGISIAKEIKKKYPQSDILFIGSKMRIESKEVSKQGFAFKSIPTFQLSGTFTFKNIFFIFFLILGIVRSMMTIIGFRPKLIIGLGGYISVSPVLAGYLLRIPLVIHEQNFSPGRANKFLSRFVDKVAVSFESSLRFFDKNKGVFTGNFIRENIMQVGMKEEAVQFFKLVPNVFTILILGGSGGAHTVNMVFLEAVELIRKSLPGGEFQVIHLTGTEDEKVIREYYTKQNIAHYTTAFLDNMGAAYHACDLAITRGGGTTTSELVYCGVPAIMIPYPFAVRDHQSENARFLERYGAAIVIQETELSAEKLTTKIVSFYNNRSLLKEMSENSKRLRNKEALDTMLCVIEGLINVKK